MSAGPEQGGVPPGENAGGGIGRWLGLAAGPLAFAALGLFLQSRGLTPEQSWAGATVALMAVWWVSEALPLWLTALVPLVVYPLLCKVNVLPIVLSYADGTAALFIGGMLIAQAMQQWGLHRRIALGIVGVIGASPQRIVLGFMCATGFITLWISNTAAAMMMFPIGMAVIKKFEEQFGRNDAQMRQFGLALMLGIAYSASIGGVGTKIGTPPNLVFDREYTKAAGSPVDFLTWLKIGLPLVVVCLPLVWLYLVKFAAKLPREPFPGAVEALAAARAEQGRMSRGEWVALAAFLSAALLWVFRADMDLGFVKLPGWGDAVPFSLKEYVSKEMVSPEIFKWLKLDRAPIDAWGDGLVGVGLALLLLCVPIYFKPLRTGLSLKEAKGAGWDMIVLLGGGSAMALGLDQTGLSKVIAGQVQSVGNVPPFVAILMVCFVATALTEVASNTATANLLLPLIPAIAKGLGMELGPLMVAATLSASFGFMLPAGTPPNAICFASGYIPVRKMVGSGFIVDVVGLFLVALVAYFVVPWALGGR